ncbi:hypothetical protein AAEK50_003978 [Serratia marcescens]|uniref:hypothetical protein n=1 Tax=Serratia nevei TaxID=2703794 RepID=UPI00329636CB
MSFLALERDVAALYYGILGKQADRATLEFFAKKLHSGELSNNMLADLLIGADDGQKRLSALDDAGKIQYIYHNIHGVYTDTEQLATLENQLSSGATLGQIAVQLSNGLRDYHGNDATALAQQQQFDNTIQQILYPSFNGGESATQSAADIQAIYYVLNSTMVPQGINYWGQKLASAQATLNNIADVFVNTRSYLTSLNDHDFVKRIFEQTFQRSAGEEDLQHYLTGLQNRTQSRGDVVAKMIAEIRSDTSSDHATAKNSFLLATHVYKPGELPENKYLETVTALYYGVAGYTMDATALEVYSKQLAAGLSTADLLRGLASSPSFADAVYWEQTYAKLFNNVLSAADRSKIWNESGKNAYVATSIVIDTFLNGGTNKSYVGWTYNAKSYERIADALGYAKQAVLTINDAGEWVGIVNRQPAHKLSDIEWHALRNAEINITKAANIVLSFAPNLQTLKMTGDKPATLDFSRNNDVTPQIILENTHVSFIGSAGDDRIIISATADMINADAQIQMDRGADWLLWQGNATAGNANIVSKHFKAMAALYDDQDATHDNVLSANFLTKDIYLTTAENGQIQGKIVSNINNFNFFQKIDLANYKGTGSIYLDGKWVASEGKNVFDFGVTRGVASIHNTEYANVSQLTQATPPPASAYQNATGDAGFALTGFADDVTVLNIPVDPWGLNYSFRTLSVLGDATANSRIHFDYLYDDRYTRTTPVMTIKFNGANVSKIDAGTLSFAIKQLQGPTPESNIYGYIDILSSGSAENTLRLAGDQNAIGTITVSGDKRLNLTIKQDFSTHLTLIDSNGTPLNLVAEKGGTGGGALYDLLGPSYAKYAAIRSELSGYQLAINTHSQKSDTLNLQGNTTLTRDLQNKSAGDTIIFTESAIDSLVTLKAVAPWSSTTTPTLGNNDTLIVGDSANPWIFSSQGRQTMIGYGEYSASETTALFNSLNLSPTATAFDLFRETLATATHGASEDRLSEVGVLKLDKNSFVIIDSNHNHTFDRDDIVFSLGNMSVSDTLKLAHYTPPKIEISASAAHSQVLESVI